MFREQHHIYKRLNNLMDAAITAASFVLAYKIRDNLATFAEFGHLGRLADFEQYSTIFVISCLIWPVFLNLNGLYPPYRERKFSRDIKVLVRSSVEATVVLIAISFLFRLVEISRLLIFSFAIVNLLLLLAKSAALKLWLEFQRRQGKNLSRVIIVGEKGTITKTIETIVGRRHMGLVAVGVITVNSHDAIPQEVLGVPVLGDISQIKGILHHTPTDQIIFCVSRRALKDVEEALFICEEEGIETLVSTDFFEMNFSKLAMEEIGGISFIVFRTAPLLNWQMVVKYSMDFVFAGIFLLVLTPVLIIVAITIKLTSNGPVLYIQDRVGLHGRLFKLYKFRSMDDTSVTSIGRFIRKAGIDELPQLLNILKGEMSFVGPRPHIPSEVERYAHDWQRRRLSMRPGLTCYRQISNPEKVTFDMAMGLDLKYIDNWSLAKDIHIFFETIPLILSRFGRRGGG